MVRDLRRLSIITYNSEDEPFTRTATLRPPPSRLSDQGACTASTQATPNIDPASDAAGWRHPDERGVGTHRWTERSRPSMLGFVSRLRLHSRR